MFFFFEKRIKWKLFDAYAYYYNNIYFVFLLYVQPIQSKISIWNVLVWSFVLFSTACNCSCRLEYCTIFPSGFLAFFFKCWSGLNYQCSGFVNFTKHVYSVSKKKKPLKRGSLHTHTYTLKIFMKNDRDHIELLCDMSWIIIIINVNWNAFRFIFSWNLLCVCASVFFFISPFGFFAHRFSIFIFFLYYYLCLMNRICLSFVMRVHTAAIFEIVRNNIPSSFHIHWLNMFLFLLIFFFFDCFRVRQSPQA